MSASVKEIEQQRFNTAAKSLTHVLLGDQLEEEGSEDAKVDEGEESPALKIMKRDSSKLLNIENIDKETNKPKLSRLPVSPRFEEEDPTDDIKERSFRNSFFRVFYLLSNNTIFSTFIIILILGNTVTLALDRHPIDPIEFAGLELANTIFSWLFFTEMLIKLMGLGIKGYTRDRFNIFDAVIVIMSTVEMVLGWADPSASGGGGAISALRGIRLLRVFKIARSWKSF